MFAAKNRLIDDQPALPAGERIIELPSALEMEHNATVLLTCHAYNRYSRSPDVSSVISSKPHCFFLAPRVSILYSKKIKKEKKPAFYQSTSSTKKKERKKKYYGAKGTRTGSKSGNEIRGKSNSKTRGQLCASQRRKIT